MLGHIPPIGQAFRSITRESSVWIRWLLVIAMLLTAIGLSFIATDQYFYLLLGLVPAIVVVLFLIRWPALGLIALIVASLLIPFAFGTGTGTDLNPTVLIIALLSGLWLMDMIAKKRQVKLVSSRTTLPLVALIISAIISFMAGQFPWFVFSRQMAPLSAQIGGLAIFFISAAAFFLVANQVREIRWLEWLTWAFISLGAIYFIGWLIPLIGSITSRLFQPGATDGGMLWTWFVAMAFAQAIFNKKLKIGWRLFLVGAVGAALYIAYFLNGGWKSGYMPALIAIAAILSLRSWRLGLLMGLVGLWLTPAIISDAIVTDEYSYATRLEAGTIILELVKTSPIVGFGPANYHFYTPLIPLRGYFAPFNSHNQYLDLLAQIGIIGLIIFFWFFFEVGKLGYQLRNRVQEGFEQAYVYGVLGGLAGTIVAGVLADWILPFVYNIGFNGLRASTLAWIFMGGLVSLGEITRRRESAEARLDSQTG